VSRELENKQIEASQRIDELLKQLTDANDAKNKMSKDHAEFTRRSTQIDFEINQLTTTNKRLGQEYEDMRMQLENEILVRNSNENKMRNLQLDIDLLNSQLEEESESKLTLNKQYVKLQEEFKTTRDRIEKETEARILEIEDTRRRLNNRYVESQDQLNETTNKLSTTEKARQKLQLNVETLSYEFEKTKKRADDATRHEKQLEKDCEELKSKLSLANAELETSYQTNRNHLSEMSKYKHLNENYVEQLDIIQKEKRRLSEESETNANQLLEAQSRLADNERKLKTIENERQLLQNELDDARDLLQIEISRNQSWQAQFDKSKTDHDKKIIDKEEEFEMQRATHRRQVESLNNQIADLETKHKADLKSKDKKYQFELDEMRTKLETAKKMKADAENNMKKLQQSNKELYDQFIEEQGLHDITKEQLSTAEKRNITIKSEVEDLKAAIERGEKGKKNMEYELHDLEEKFNECSMSYNRALAEKKKYESDWTAAGEELHEIKIEMRNVEEKLRNATACLLKKDEELRHEKEVTYEIEASKRGIEQQLQDSLARLEGTEELVKREAKRLSAKIEGRVSVFNI
jgi:chromosome segregation ATPase